MASLVVVDSAVANLTATPSELVVIESETILAAEMAVTATVVPELVTNRKHFVVVAAALYPWIVVACA